MSDANSLVPKLVSTIVLVQLPKKLNYFVGEKKLDLSGGQICAIYEDGSFETLPMDGPEMEFAFDSGQEGPAIVTLSYQEKTLLFQIHIRAPVVRKFIVISPPDKKDYLAGETIDLTGLKLEAQYETGERVPWEDIPAVNDKIQKGDAVYPLTIKNITVPIYIKVKDSKLVSIEMGKLPLKTEYLERKESFSAAGATIIKTYDSGVREEVPLQAAAVRGFSNLVVGPQTLTVQIGAFQTTFDVYVREKAPLRLIAANEPYKLNYVEGQPIEMDGLKLSVEYDNGETRFVEEYDYEPKIAELSQMFVQVKVGEARTEIAIGVTPRQLTGIEVIQSPHKTKYLEKKDLFEAEGAELQLNYDHGEPTCIPITNDMVHGFDNRQAGECVLEVQYNGFITQLSVEITPQQLIGILISKPPDKTDYAPGEMFEKQGMQVSGFYNNGLLQAINSYMLSPDRPLKESDVAVVVTSMDKSAIVPVRVAEMFREETPTETPPPAPEMPEAALEEVPLNFSEKGPKPADKKKGLFGRIFYPPSDKLRDLNED